MNIQPDVDGIVNARVERRNQQARQDQWAAEMDRAFFAAMTPGQPAQFQSEPANQVAAPQVAARRADSAMVVTSRGAVSARGSDPAQGGDGATAGRVARDTQEDDTPAAGANATADAAQAQAAGTGRTAWQPGPPAAGGADGMPLAPGGAAALPADGAAMAGFAATPPGSAGAAPASAPAAMPSAAALAPAPAAGIATLPPAAFMPAWAPAVGGAQADAAMASAMEQDAPAAAGEPDGGDTQAYAQRLLHIYQDQNQVQAWIRDAALAPAHIAAVAQALAGQLSAQGTRLSALTVNGRAVALGYAAGAAGGFQDAIEIISGAPTPPGQTKEEEQ